RAHGGGEFDGVDQQDPGQPAEQQPEDVVPASVPGLEEQEHHRHQKGGRDQHTHSNQRPGRPAPAGQSKSHGGSYTSCTCGMRGRASDPSPRSATVTGAGCNWSNGTRPGGAATPGRSGYSKLSLPTITP